MKNRTFKPGQEWLDNDGRPIQAHGGHIIYDNGKYYWFGEDKSLTTSLNAPCWHDGVRCYSSSDLYNWENKGTVLEANDDINSPLCRNRIIDRPHVLYNKKTNKYVMWIKLSGTPDKPRDWSTQHTGIAVCDRINGKYELVSFMPTSSLRFEKWGAKSVSEWGLRMIVGKTTMGKETIEAMQKYGCVHVSPQCVSPNLWQDSIKIQGVELFSELGSIEACWQMELSELGPFIVDIDTNGRCYFDELDVEVAKNREAALDAMGVPKDFVPTKLY